jgi:hypothetical protein
MWLTRDPDGRLVVLSRERWAHILGEHPYIGVDRETLLKVVAAPDARVHGRRPGEEHFYRQGAGPSAWIRVVVHYERDRGLIVTAFPRRAFP